MATEWSQEELKILVDNYNIIGYRATNRLIPRHCYSSITKKAKEYGLIPLTRSQVAKKIFYDINYFSTPTIENSYWAGFIASDGCINKKGVTFHLSILDIEHLKNFQLQTNHNGKISISKPREIFYQQKEKLYISKESCHLQFCGTEWPKDLLQYWNITPRKSKTLKAPNIIDINLCLAYIVGLIDGDGSICISKNTTKDTRYPSIVLYGTKVLLEWVKSILDSVIPLHTNYKNSNPYKIPQNIYSLTIGGKRAISIYTLLKSLPIKYKLDRKWNKFDILVKQKESVE